MPHEAEFVGAVQMSPGGTLPAADVLTKWTTGRCYPGPGPVHGLTRAQFDTRDDIGLTWDSVGQAPWAAGDRSVRRFALCDPGRKARASIKGLGKKALPV